MDDVAELQARIEVLSSEITLQKQLLRNLERDKSQVQRRLNEVLDPVARLPLEISSEIFLQTLPFVPERPSVHKAPILLLDVCSAWTNIALSAPALWAASVYADCPGSEGSQEGLQAWLQRAGSHALSVYLRGDCCDNSVAALIREYGVQFKHLEILVTCEQEENDDIVPGFGLETIDLVGVRNLEPLALLETLTIRGVGFDLQAFPVQQILALLGLAPNLIECTFHDIYPVGYGSANTASNLVLPALRRMMFGESEIPSGTFRFNDDSVLKLLTLPAVQTLVLPLRNLSLNDLLMFLKRSSPPLKELITLSAKPNSVTLPECLHLVPTLQHFEMFSMGTSLLHELLTALINSPSLVPDLHSLRIVWLYLSDNIEPGPCWELLLRVLSSRSQLRIVHIVTGREIPDLKPATGILDALGEMVMGGRQIYIGNTGRNSNLVSV
ncbi:hypothetical protein DFH06DRAFT_292781 [Mycena polygramma]|nr:hypothetical protein DFH06DRAFT_292781 [Mycena polygramma]